jgi:putative ABC transport system permease protein
VALPLSYSLRSLWVRRGTTLATATGIALVVFVLSASQMLAAGMKSTLLRAGHADRALVLQRDAFSEDDSGFRQQVLALVKAAPGVRRDESGDPVATGESVMQLMLQRLDNETRISGVQIRGVSDHVARLRPNVVVTRGRWPSPGADEAMIGEGIAGDFEGMDVGGSFELKRGRPIQVVGAFESGQTAHESEVWVPLDTLRTSLGWEGFLSSITVQLEDASAFDGFASALEGDGAQGVEVIRESDYYDRVSEGLSDSVRILGTMVVFIFSFGAMLGAAITFYGSIGQRRREIGVLRAIGFSAGSVLATFLIEALALSLAGGGLGTALAALTPLIDFSTTNFGTGNEIRFPFEPRLGILVSAIAAGTVVGVLGGLFPALKAARTDPVAAMRV